MKNWLYRGTIQPLLALLRQGISPEQLALCVAIGLVVGNIPIFGVSTILCAVIAMAFRLNLAAIQLVQAAMAPTQVLLIVPFVRLGEWLLRAPRQPVSIEAGFALMQQGMLRALFTLRDAMVHAGTAWLLVAPPAIFLLYRLLTPLFERAGTRFRRRQAG